MGTIQNGSDTPLNQGASTNLPNMVGALANWFQPMQFKLVTKTTMGFQLVETSTAINFRGVIQPLKPRMLEIKPEGQRAWSWFVLHSDTSLRLSIDDIVVYLGTPTRVMAVNDFSSEGFMEYQLAQNWTGRGANP